MPGLGKAKPRSAIFLALTAGQALFDDRGQDGKLFVAALSTAKMPFDPDPAGPDHNSGGEETRMPTQKWTKPETACLVERPLTPR